jgi:hypothetical protein
MRGNIFVFLHSPAPLAARAMPIVFPEYIQIPKGRSPTALRLRQKDWQVGSGRGIRR